MSPSSGDDATHDRIGYVRTVDFTPNQNSKYKMRKIRNNKLERKYACEKCGASYPQESSLYQHNKSVHEMERFTCGYCDFKATRKFNIKRHEQNFHENIRIPCDYCDYLATSTRNLNRHTNSKHKGVRHSCDKCDKRFKSLDGLKYHEETNHSETLFDCSECDFKTYGRMNLLFHIRRVHKKMMYKCLKCDFRSDRTWNVKYHVRSKHDNIKYPCQKCDYEGFFVTYLKQHSLNVHKEELTSIPDPVSVAKCKICKHFIGSKEKLEKHVKEKHGKSSKRSHKKSEMSEDKSFDEDGLKFQCKFCPKTFRFQAHVSQHERSHTKEKPFECHRCNKAFTAKCNLKAHMETHKSLEERSFKCDKCDHRATSLPLLKLHQYNHTGERPFVCDLCGESYKRPHNLRRHKKTMCRLRPGGVKMNKTEEAVTEEAEVYERIETVVVQGEDGVIIETAHAQYEESGGAMFVEDGIRILPDVFVHEEAVMAEDIVEEGIVEEDGIKYETPLLIM